jgi:cell division protein FtsN
MAEDGFREIQLNGKQIVFLFMATAVVAVVIFLSGVMVGRGVRAEKGALGEADTLTSPPAARGGTEPQPTGAVSTSTLPPAQGQAASDELSYYNRLEAAGAPTETLKPTSTEPAPPVAEPHTRPGGRETPAPPVPAPPAAAAKQPAPPADSAPKNAPPQESRPPAPRVTPPARAVDPPEAASKASAEPSRADPSRSAEPAGSSFSVQVSALRNRAGAEAVLKDLSARGYDGYIVGPQAGSSLYRVRVGKFRDRRDAEELRRRLEKENFKPLITR